MKKKNLPFHQCQPVNVKEMTEFFKNSPFCNYHSTNSNKKYQRVLKLLGENGMRGEILIQCQNFHRKHFVSTK